VKVGSTGCGLVSADSPRFRRRARVAVLVGGEKAAQVRARADGRTAGLKMDVVQAAQEAEAIERAGKERLGVESVRLVIVGQRSKLRDSEPRAAVCHPVKDCPRMAPFPERIVEVAVVVQHGRAITAAMPEDADGVLGCVGRIEDVVFDVDLAQSGVGSIVRIGPSNPD